MDAEVERETLQALDEALAEIDRGDGKPAAAALERLRQKLHVGRGETGMRAEVRPADEDA